MSDMTAEIRTLVAKIVKLPEDKIKPDANLFSDLGIDSMLGVEIFAALDKKYHINIPEEDLKKVNTLNDLTSLIEKLLPKG